MQFLKGICIFAPNMTENLTGEAHRPGRIEVVCGSMFSGKTEELIRRMRRAQFARQKVEIFKPAIDVRYSEEDVVSHDQKHIQSTPIDSAGLDMDYKGKPFGPMPALCAIADDVTKVHAICVKCGNLAYVSHRKVDNDQRVLLGETAEYEPLCRECYQKAIKEENERKDNNA